MDEARVAFGQSLLLLATALQHELDTPEIGVYWHALKGIPEAIRRETFAIAQSQPWRRFPQPGELKALAAGVVRAKREAAARVHLADCPHGAARMVENEQGRMVRCACFKQAMAAMAAVGQPVALPAAQEEA